LAARGGAERCSPGGPPTGFPVGGRMAGYIITERSAAPWWRCL